jgi:hypothetical protein
MWKPTIVLALDDPTSGMSADKARKFVETLLHVCQANNSVQLFATTTDCNHWMLSVNLDTKRDEAFSVLERVKTKDGIVYENTDKRTVDVYYLPLSTT